MATRWEEDAMNDSRRLIQTVIILCSMLCLVLAAEKSGHSGSIQVTEEKLTIPGIRNEYHFFLIADTHISLCDERDSSLMEKAGSRKQAFEQESGKTAARTFQNLVTQANDRGVDLAVFAGDIIDSAMYASIDFVKKQFDRLQMPYMYIAGNHDFEYGEEYFSKKAYQDYFPRLQELTGTDKQYILREYEDLIIAGINDNNNQFPKSAVKALLPVMEKDKPVILVLHVPLQPQFENSELEQQANDVWGLSSKGKCRVLLGENACKPNAVTRRLLNAVFSDDSPVAAVFAGHIHFYNRSMLNDTAVQTVSGAGYYGDAVHIRVTPQ